MDEIPYIMDRRHSMKTWSAAHAEELSVAPVLEQLRSRRIRAIRFMQGTSGNAFLLPERGGTFEILVSRYIPLEWPLCIGHEIAHSYFMIWSDDLTTFHRANGSGSQYAKAEEELCEIFAEIWIRSSNNYRETFELISRLYPPR